LFYPLVSLGLVYYQAEQLPLGCDVAAFWTKHSELWLVVVWDAYQVISFWKLERKFRQAIMPLVIIGDDD
jgi:hypothetical protein